MELSIRLIHEGTNFHIWAYNHPLRDTIGYHHDIPAWPRHLDRRSQRTHRNFGTVMTNIGIELIDWFGTIPNGAEFSSDKKHRFVLWRIWDNTKPVAMCIGLNPSNANNTKNDPTITRTCNVLKQLGFGGLRMVNLFTFITSNPNEVKDQTPDMAWILTTAYQCQEIIFAWGSFKQIPQDFVAKLSEQFPDAKCFGKTEKGQPWHPSPLNRQMTAAYKNGKQLERFKI